ncbi:MAG: AMP-binding protein [Gemmatimonadota bacterium]|nr:MAG: AMP-binding protein [Gemmatimonadota bacterium]
MTATMAVSERAAVARDQSINSVADIIRDRLPTFGRRPAIRYDDGSTYRTLDFIEYVGNIRRALQVTEPGQERQRIVCTFVMNRPEWDMLALATLYTGNILFPLDTKMHEEELAHLLKQSPPDLVLVSPASRQRMKSVLRQLAIPSQILIADLYHVFEDRDAPTIGELDDNERRFSSVPVSTRAGFPPPSPRLERPELILGHYATSGTTSLPKLVRITHGNIVAQVNEGMDVMNLRKAEDLLNIGPYTHIATLLEFLVTKAKGFSVTYFTREADQDTVLEDEIKKMKRLGVRIKALMAVPKFWIYIMKEVLEEMKNKAVWRNLYEHLTSIEKHAKLQDVGTLDKAKLNAMRILLRNKMGGHFSYGISSSTRIDPGVVEIFAKLGVTVIDIYGATEASGIIARNRLNESRRGSCGRLIAGLEFKIDRPRTLPGSEQPVGELLARSPTISAGYVGQQPDAHLDTDGFYHTGDLAWVDEQRWVYLVGREKELIEWEDGSLIDRMHLSNLLVRSIWVKDALVTRLNDDDYLSVFVFPDWPRIKKDREYQAALATGVRPEEALRSRLLEAVAYAQSLADITPRLSTDKIYILERRLERTPTHKIKFIRELERLDLGSYV